MKQLRVGFFAVPAALLLSIVSTAPAADDVLYPEDRPSSGSLFSHLLDHLEVPK